MPSSFNRRSALAGREPPWVRAAIHTQDLSCYLTSVRQSKEPCPRCFSQRTFVPPVAAHFKTSIPGPMEALPGVELITETCGAGPQDWEGHCQR